MKKNISKKYNNCIKIRISSLNQEQIFQKLLNSNIEITNLTKNENFESEFCVKARNYQETIRILNLFNAKIVSSEKQGFLKLSQSFFSKIGVVIACAILLVLFLFSNVFILDIKIVGNSILTTSQINSFLLQQGVHTLSYKSNINIANLELELVNNFKEISMANVVIKGKTIVVNIKEKNEAEILSAKTENLVSNFNGRILEFSLISGTANVKVGDVVKKGDILVYNRQDNIQGSVVAKAKIVAEVWIEENYLHSEQKIILSRTGEKVVANNINVFGIGIYNSTKGAKNFEKFEVETSVSKLKNTILPLQVETKTYYEVKEEEINEKYDEERRKLILAQCKENALQHLCQDDIIINEKVIENAVGEVISVTYLLVVERHLD